MAASDFWDNQEKAQETVGQMKSLRSLLEPLDECLAGIEDLDVMLEMAEEDDSLAAEVPGQLDQLEETLEALELKALLDGPYDNCGAIVTINARDGGTDANDWAEMLLTMYGRWADQHDYAVELIDRTENEEAGINNATFVVRGPMALRLS